MSNVLRVKNNYKHNQEYGKLKKKIPSQVYFKYFVDTEQLSKMQISSQVFFKDFVDRFGTTYLKMDFSEVVFRKFC